MAEAQEVTQSTPTPEVVKAASPKAKRAPVKVKKDWEPQATEAAPYPKEKFLAETIDPAVVVDEPMVPTKDLSVFERCAYSMAWAVLKRTHGTPFDCYARYYEADEMKELYKIRMSGEIARKLAINALLDTEFRPYTYERECKIAKENGEPMPSLGLRYSKKGLDYSELDMVPVTNLNQRLLYVVIDMAAREYQGCGFWSNGRFYDRDEMNALYGINMRGEDAVQRAIEYIEAQGYRRIERPEDKGKEEVISYDNK